MFTLPKIQTAAIVAGATASIALASPVVAKQYRDYVDYNNTSTDYARVVDVQNVYETISVNHPTNHCWNEKVPARYAHRRSGKKSYTSEVLGGIIGAAVGNQFGNGSGRDAATVAGALLGGSIARNIKHGKYARGHGHRHGHYEVVKRCETRDNYRTEQKIVGYDVAYKYRGKVYHTQMADYPSNKIKVRVTVDPVL